MGVIARQSSKKSIVSFIGVLIGAISILFIYPYEKETYGLALFIFSSANLLLSIFSLGSHGLIQKYYPVFNKNKIKGFVSLILIIILSSILISSIVFFLFRGVFFDFMEWMGKDAGRMLEYALPIYLLTLLLIFINFLIYHSGNLNRIVIPSILNDPIYKILLASLILAVYLGWISRDDFIELYVGYFIVFLVLMLLYVYSLGGLKIQKISFGKISLKLRKEMGSYMLFSGLNHLGAGVATRIDAIMVTAMVSFSGTGIYGILLFMSNVIDIPVRSINQIASPVISASMEKNERENISSIYKKSSINAFVSGSFIFLMIWGLLSNIIDLMPNNEDIFQYKNVFLFLGLGKLIDMVFSTNTYLIIYSKYFKYNLYFVLFLAFLNLILNYFFISYYGLTGAAMATASSLVLYNLVKLFFIKVKMNYWPFSSETSKMVLISIITFIITLFLPDIFLNWVDILIKAPIICVVFGLQLKLFKVKADVINLMENYIYKMIAWGKSTINSRK